MRRYSGSFGEYGRYDDEAIARVLQAQEMNDGFRDISINGKPSCKMQQPLEQNLCTEVIYRVRGGKNFSLCLETTNVREGCNLRAVNYRGLH